MTTSVPNGTLQFAGAKRNFFTSKLVNKTLKTISIVFNVMAFLLLSGVTKAQVANYTFAPPGTQTYTSQVAGSTGLYVVGSPQAWDDNVYAVSLPWSFTFNGTPYTALSVNSNGYITFGTNPSSSTNYTPIATAGTYAGAVAAISRDLVAGSSTFVNSGAIANNSTTVTVASGNPIPLVGSFIVSSNGNINSTVTAVSGSVLTISPAAGGAVGNGKTFTFTYPIITNSVGTAPNRKFYIEWINADIYNGGATGSSLDFQIILNESTNIINFNYGVCTPATTVTAQVGLRGAANTDYKDLSVSWSSPTVTTTGTGGNALTEPLSATKFPATNLLYTFSPAVASPTLTATALAAFGNECVNGTTGPNNFTVTGSNLSGNVTIGALAGYNYSATSGGTYTSTLTLTPASGSLSAVPVYVEFTPTAATTYNGNIPISGGGATAINVAASGTGVTLASTTGAASAITASSATVAGTFTNACSLVTAYGIEYSTTSGFTPGSGTKVPSTNQAAGSYTSALSGLATGVTYYYVSYATTGSGTVYGSQSSFATASPTLSATALTAFGNVCINTTAGPNSFTVTGTNLSGTVTVGALTGYTYSATSGGTYNTTLTLTPTGGNLSAVPVYVKFTPTAVASYNGNISVSGGGATAVNVAASGTGINTPPTATSGSASTVTATTATVAGSYVVGCTATTAYGIEYGTAAFTPGTGTQAAGTGGTSFTSSLGSPTALTPQTQYFYDAYATSTGGTGYGSQLSFYTLSNPATAQATNFTATPGNSTVTLNWTAATFPSSGATATGYILLYSSTVTPALTSANGTAPAGTGTLINITNGATITSTINSLSNGSTYKFLLVPYTWDGTNAGTYNYYTTSAPTTCALLTPSIPGGIALGTPTPTTIPGSTAAVASGTATGYVIFYSTTNTAPVPANGTSYTLAASPYTIGTVSYYAINQTTAGAFTASGLTANTPYYFWVYSYSNTTCGSTSPVYSGGYQSAITSTTANTFYSVATTNLQSTGVWWSNTDGATGANPANFTTAGITYNIITPGTTVITSAWTVSGTGSIVNIGDGVSATPTVNTAVSFSAPTINILAGSTLATTGGTLTASTAITVGANATLKLGSTTAPSIAAATLDPASTVIYASSSAQTIGAYNYGNLTSSSSGARTLISSGTIGIAGTFTPGSNVYTIGTSTVNFNGGNQTIPAPFSFYNLTVTASTGNVTILSSGNINVAGTFTDNSNGIYGTTGNTVTFNGTTIQTIPAISPGYNNLTFSNNSGTTANPSTFAASTTVNGTFNFSGSGTLAMDNAATFTHTINNWTMGGSGTIDLGRGGLTVATVNVSGNINQTSGLIWTSGNVQNGKIFMAGSGTTQNLACSKTAYIDISISAPSVVALTGNVYLFGALIGGPPGGTAYNSTLAVASGSTLNCGTFAVANYIGTIGSQTSSATTNAKYSYFTLNSGANIITANTAGLVCATSAATQQTIGATATGSIQTAFRSFNSAANYTYNGSSAQVTGIFATTPGTNTVNKLTIDNAAGVSLSQATTIATSLTIGDVTDNSIFYDNGFAISSVGTLNLGDVPYNNAIYNNASKYILGSSSTATLFPSFGTINIGAGTTVQYNAGNGTTQTISKVPNYYNLAVVNATGSGAATKNLATTPSTPTALTVYGSISIGANNTFDVTTNNYGISVGGSFLNSGTFTGRAGTVTFNGGAANTQIESTTQSLLGGGGSFFNILHNNSDLVQLTGALTAGGTLTNGISGQTGTGNFDANANTNTVTGLTTIYNGTYLASTNTQTLIGGLTISGSAAAFTGSTGNVAVGSSTVAGALTLSNGTLTAPSGTFSVFGNWAQSGGTFTPGANTVTFTAPTTKTQTISTGTGTAVANSNFNNISHTGAGLLQILTGSAPLTTLGTFTNASGAGNFDANTFAHTVTGLTTISGGSYLASTGTQSHNGGLTVSGGTYTGSTGIVNTTNVTISSGTLTAPSSTGTFNVGGNWSNALTASFAANGGTVNFIGGTPIASSGVSGNYGLATQTISGAQKTNFNTLNIQSATSTTLASNIGLTGNLTVSTSGTGTIFDMVTYTANSTSTGTMRVQGTGTLRLSGTTGGQTGSNFPSGFSSYTLTLSSTTEYYDATSTGQLVTPVTSYGNLTITNGSGSIKTAPASLTIGNSLLINTGATFAVGSYTHNVGANWTNNGTFTAGTSTINFNGTVGPNAISGNLTGTSKFNYLTFNSPGGGIWSFSNAADVAADFTLTNGSVTAPSGLLNVAGDWINNGGSFSGGSGTVSLNGGVAQAIKGSNSTTFNKLDINNSAGLTDVLQIATTAATISFTNSGGNGSGYIDATNFPLTLTTPAAITSASPTGHVIVTGAANSGLTVQGVPQTTGFQFPIGVVSSGNHYYLPATVAPETAPNNGLTWTAKVYTPVTTNGVYNSGLNYSGVALEGIINVAWDITPTGYQNINVDKTLLTVNWVYNPAIENPLFLGYGSNIGISHFTSGAWQGATTTGSANNGSDAVNSTNYVTSEFTSFSPFAVGPKDDPLPVILVDFNAVLNNNRTVGLTWTTQQEINTSHFEVERSADGIVWTSIGTVQAAGNSSLPSHYEFTDASPLSSNFYRIKMVNINNDFGYTTSRFIKLLQVKEILVFPNPARNYVNVSVSKAEVDLNVKLINQIGQVMQVSQIKAGSGTVLTFDLHNYAQGTYFVQVSGSDGTMQTNKIIIMR